MISSDRQTSNADHEIQKHSTIFFHYSQPIILQVEDEFFQLPKILFPHSETLIEVYPELKSSSVGTVTIQLYNCRKIDVEAFLTVLLQPLGHLFPPDHPCSEPTGITVETLLNALDFANQWGFRTMALDLTERVDKLLTGPFERIIFGKLHRVMLWFRSGLEELVESEEDISIEDANRIGLVLTLKIYHTRSRIRLLLADAGASDPRSTVAARMVEEIFTGKSDPWTFPECYIAGTKSNATEEQLNLNGQSSSYDELEGEGNLSQSKCNDSSDISLADLGYSDEDDICSSENLESVGDDILEVIVPEEKRTIRELVTAILHGETTASPRLLSVVPKVCVDRYKKNKKCGKNMRCRKCCIRRLKADQPIPGALRARTPLGQVLLDRLGEIINGNPISSEIVLQNVEKSCNKIEKTCGSSRRCSKCCKKAAKVLLGKGEIV